MSVDDVIRSRQIYLSDSQLSAAYCQLTRPYSENTSSTVLYSQSYDVLYNTSLALKTSTSGVITMPLTPVRGVNESCIRNSPPEIDLMQSTPHVIVDLNHSMTDEFVLY